MYLLILLFIRNHLYIFVFRMLIILTTRTSKVTMTMTMKRGARRLPMEAVYCRIERITEVEEVVEEDTC